MKKIISRFVQLIFLGIGVAIFISVIKKVGWNDVLQNLLKINFWFIPVFILSLFWYLCYTKAWEALLKTFSGELSTFDVFRAKVAGEAVNSMSPVSFVVGDPVRIYLLSGEFPVKEGAASVVVDRTIHTISILCVVLLGIIVGFPVLDFLPRDVRVGVPIFFGILAVFMTLIIIFQKRGIFVLPFKLMIKMNIKKKYAKKTMAHMEELDDNIRGFYDVNKKGFIKAFLYHLTGRLSGIIEVFILGYAITDMFTLRMAVLLVALSPIVNVTFAFVPGALGAVEGAYSALLYVLGLDPSVGFTIQIARRIRSAIWIVIGLIFIALHKKNTAQAVLK